MRIFVRRLNVFLMMLVQGYTDNIESLVDTNQFIRRCSQA